MVFVLISGFKLILYGTQDVYFSISGDIKSLPCVARNNVLSRNIIQTNHSITHSGTIYSYVLCFAVMSKTARYSFTFSQTSDQSESCGYDERSLFQFET